MSDKDVIYIPEQFERASELGYLGRHIELTKKLQGLFEREDKPADMTHADRLALETNEEFFHQACEDVARHLLLSDKSISSIPVSEAQGMVEEKYNAFLANPKLAAASRALAVH